MDSFKLDTGFDIALDDFYVEFSKNEKRILRVTRKTLPDDVEYMFIKILKKVKDDEYNMLEQFRLTRDEFEAMVKIFSRETQKCLCCSNCLTNKDIVENISRKHKEMIAEVQNIFFLKPEEETEIQNILFLTPEDAKVVAEMENFFLTSGNKTTTE